VGRDTAAPPDADSHGYGEDPGTPADPDDDERPQTQEPDGSDFSLDPAPARSDQLPEDAPEPVAPD